MDMIKIVSDGKGNQNMLDGVKKKQPFPQPKTIVKGQVDVSGIKRCYVAAWIRLPCPSCGEEISMELESNYLSHPEVGEDEVCMCCAECGSGYVLPIRILSVEMVIEYDSGEIRVE